jgi:aldehyde dehydrogenase (NAD+)
VCVHDDKWSRKVAPFPSAAAHVEGMTHKTFWTVNHGTEIKMAQGLTTAIDGSPA